MGRKKKGEEAEEYPPGKTPHRERTFSPGDPYAPDSFFGYAAERREAHRKEKGCLLCLVPLAAVVMGGIRWLMLTCG